MPPSLKRPKKSGEALLFHPKKKRLPAGERQVSSPQKSSHLRPSPPTPKPNLGAKPEPKPEADDLKLPSGGFQEFRLMSSALNGWKYDVMKFDSRKPVDIGTWQTPIKLNRKEPRRDERSLSGSQEAIAVGPMLGPDGKPVIGPDGLIVMVDAEGRPIRRDDGSGEASGSGTGKDRDKAKGFGNGKKFQKKTRQVFLVPETTRQLRKEERYPWVMEDASHTELWVGKLEDLSKSETHAFFMPAANDVFKFVPAHRWYKFQKKPTYHIPNLEEAESIMARMQKNKDPERWLLHNRNGKAPSLATAAAFKAEAEVHTTTSGSYLIHTAGQSLAPGGRRLKTVDTGGNVLPGEEEDEDKRARNRNGADGDMDEIIYEEDFADDDEKIEDDGDDEEARDLEERLKREYKIANKQRDGYVDESDDDVDDQLTKDGKAIKKLIRNLEKNTAYDSEEEKNPYASSEEEEQEPHFPTEPPVVPQPPSRSGSLTPAKPTPSLPQTRPGSRSASRPSSPAPPSSILTGHSIVAKRATSPKPSKVKRNGVSRDNSPLSGRGNRATSPNGVGGSRATSPVSLKHDNKRKATDDLTGHGATAPGGPPKAKKRKSHGVTGVAAVPAGELEDRAVIEWLRNTPNATTRDCIQQFTPYLTDESKKIKFTTLVKEVAQLKGGVLVLRNAHRGGSAASSPKPVIMDS